MGMDWGNIAAVAGVGALTGLATHEAEVKAKEEQDYNRGRQAIADQQAAEIHAQNVKKNEFTLQADARDQAEAVRKQGLNDRIGMYQKMEAQGLIGDAAQSYVDFANQDNVGNPNFDQSKMLGYSANTDGTVNINILDRATGKVVQTARQNVGIKDFIAATYQQLDPSKSYETQVANAAAAAKTQAEQAWELKKMGVKNYYDLYGENAKHQNALELEGIRQQGATYRTELTQEGLNFRDGNGGTGGSSGGKSGKTSSAVESGVNGALQFAENNRGMMQFLSGNPQLANMTLAMMGIESAGNPNAFSGSSHGLMQIHGKYSNYFAKKFGIQGNPLTDPQANLQTGAALIQHLSNKYGGDIELVAAAYNAGEGAVDNAIRTGKQTGKPWFDSFDPKTVDVNQVRNHVIKFVQAMGLLDGNYQPTGNTVQQVNQNADQKGAKTKNDYAVKASAASMAGINNTVKSMGAELGEKNTAKLIGALRPSQNTITAFANKPDYASRNKALNDLVAQVESVVKTTPNGMTMTPREIKEYSKQKAAEMVGASGYAEAAIWASQGSKKQAKTATQPKGNLSASEVDNLFMEVQAPSAQPAAKPAATKPANKPAPIANPMQRAGIQETLGKARGGAFVPYRAAPTQPAKPAPRQAPTTMAGNMRAIPTAASIAGGDFEKAKKYYHDNY